MDAQASEHVSDDTDQYIDPPPSHFLSYFNKALAALVFALGMWALLLLITPQFFSSLQNIVTKPVQENAVVSNDVVGFWNYICERGESGYNECYAQQESHGRTEQSKLIIKIVAAKQNGTIYPRLKLITPMGSFLPAGMMIDLSDQQSFNVDYQFCQVEEQGCLINLDLEDDMVQLLNKVNVMHLQYALQPNLLSEHDIYLYGIADVIERLRHNAYWPMRSARGL